VGRFAGTQLINRRYLQITPEPQQKGLSAGTECRCAHMTMDRLRWVFRAAEFFEIDYILQTSQMCQMMQLMQLFTNTTAR
jgi:hypothetical protein